MVKEIRMKLSPVNIKRQEFSKELRGYNTKEVTDFLEKVADEVESALKENETLRRTIDHLNLDVERYKTIEDSLQKALIAAQESSGTALQKAHEEAAAIVGRAEEESSLLLADSQNMAIELQKHIAELEERRAYILARLSAIIETQESVIGERKLPETPVEEVVQIAEPSELAESGMMEHLSISEEPEVEIGQPKKETTISEEEKRKKLSELFFTGSSDKIDINNIVED